MAAALRVLMVEDNEDDAFLLERELRRSGFEPHVHRVDTTGALEVELAQDDWELALVDYYMPKFSGPEALDQIVHTQPDLPTIIVSANIGEEAAVASMRAGASDYVMKGKLSRLGPAVRRALREAEERRERRQAEESLRRSEERYRALFDRSTDCVFIVDLEGRVLDLNPAAARLVGYDKRELAASGPAENRKLIDSPDLSQALEEVIATGTTLTPREFRLRKKDGGHVHMEAQGSLIFRDGRPYAIQGIARDITTRKHTEDALREREERLRQVTDNMLDLISVTDATGSFTYVSPSNTKVLGYQPEEMLGRTVLDFTHPDDLAGMHEAAQRGIAERRAGTQEFRFRHRDGHHLWLESVGNLILDEAGEVAGGVFGSRDITDRKLAEEALRRSEEHFRLLVEQATDIITIFDLDGTLRFISPSAQKVFGDHLDDLLGHNLRELCHPDDVYNVLPPPGADLEALREPHTREVRFRHRDGGWRVLEGIGRVYDDERGVPQVLVNSRDLTERHREEEAQRVAQKMDAISRLAGGVAHELNNLLGVITGYCEVLEDALGESDPLRTDLREIARAATRSTKLTKQLLLLSREPGERPGRCDLHQLIEELTPMIEGLVGERAALTLTPLSGPTDVAIDAGGLSQVLVALAANAVDAMPGGGELRVEWQKLDLSGEGTRRPLALEPGTYVKLSVRDTGEGMSQDVMAKAFEPFFTTRADDRHAGLGLSTAFGLVRQAGGTVEVESEPGAGCTVEVYLPCCESSATRAGLSATPSPTAGHAPHDQLSPATVLVVEDDDAFRGLVSRMLERDGHQVVTAADAQAALARSAEHQGTIALLVTDVVLPKIGGAELAAQLQRARPELKVLFMTGYGVDDLASHGVSEQQASFLLKPFTAAEFTAAVQRVLLAP